MSRVVRALMGLVLIISCAFFSVQPQAQALDLSRGFVSAAVLGERVNPADQVLETEYGKKIDLNNANVRLFREVRGFYPTLAKLIVNNGPYESVEDVLNIPDLSESQVAKLQANLDRFTVTPPSDVFLDGDERLNNGNY
ncbi:photosystem II 12 kDa extrinsic protein PsbU [[Synechococcus] sp. NIES-970]|uniref:photosystem II complex extrinsic protein PsbU n=1 Tax=Picosynechococcus sp. NKBG15041c TaxID=1407650 RepID=UPI000467362B|nr:photosystem II complex extrinsic protein PsbU [Picosynechococcus sp. NKBG15041c]BAW95474.1 photosystem II 12 kDa extrinsic protein PsbU [[Synechococcus] sp. NIES-970]